MIGAKPYLCYYFFKSLCVVYTTIMITETVVV